MRLSGSGAGLVAIAGAGALVWLVTELADDGHEPLLVVSLALIALVALDAVTAWRAVPPTMAAAVLDDGVAGGTVPYALEVPARRWPVVVALLAPPFGGPVGRVHVAAPGPVTAPLPALERGAYPWQAFQVSAPGPLGLVTAQRRYRLPTPLVVGPAPVPHPLAWPPPPASLAPDETRRAAGEDLFRGVRDYRRGDPRRAVHWRATAHHGTLMVREHEATGIRTVRVAVGYLGVGPAAETALGRAAAVVEDACRQGWRVRLVTCQPAQPQAPDPPLRRASGSLVPIHTGPVPTMTVEGEVADRHELARRLALAHPGPVERRPAGGGVPTRWVAPGGDTW